jgi:hypothetical protein
MTTRTETELNILGFTTYGWSGSETLHFIAASQRFRKSVQGLRIRVKYPSVQITDAWSLTVMARKWSVEFVNIELNATHRKELKKIVNDAEYDVGTLLTNLVTDGYRIGLAYNPEKDSFTCSLTAKDTAAHNEGFCMVSHSGTPIKALLTAVYKHYSIAKGAEWRDVADTDDEFS